MGHKRTIRPNAKKLSALFMDREKMDWQTFAKKVKTCQRGFMEDANEIKPGVESSMSSHSHAYVRDLFPMTNPSTRRKKTIWKRTTAQKVLTY